MPINKPRDKGLPDSIDNLANLKTLTLFHHKLEALPAGVERVVERLKSRGCIVERMRRF
nr:hypothetical protein [Candidatus Sigynarchaeota archaeon]